MSDASAVQLLTSALGGGVLVGLLNLSLRLREFRREDRARWVSDRRQAWAFLLDHANHMLAECAPLAEIVKVASTSGDPKAKNRAKKIAEDAYDHWIDTQPHVATLRLLAGSAALPSLEDLDHCLKSVAVFLVAISLFGVCAEEDRLRIEVSSAQQAINEATQAARRDIIA